MFLVDTHAHLYGEQFDNDIEKVLQRAYHSGIQKIFLPAIDHETHDKLLKLANAAAPPSEGCYIPTIYPTMGVHPCSINENYKQELETALNYLNNGTKYYAVGEIGLDFHWDVTFKEQQFEAFETQINWAIERNLPIVIHARKSTYDCIQLVKKYKGKVNGIFHCFSGSTEEAAEIIKLGFYLGIGGVATYKNSGLQELLKDIDLSHIVLETDAPYLTPVPHRGKRNESSYIRIIADEVARIKGISLMEVADVTSANAMKVFQL
jgi:TatD DNase family protein